MAKRRMEFLFKSAVLFFQRFKTSMDCHGTTPFYACCAPPRNRRAAIIECATNIWRLSKDYFNAVENFLLLAVLRIPTKC